MRKTVHIFLYRYGKLSLLDNYVKALTAADMCPVVSEQIKDCIGCEGLLLPGGGDSAPHLYGQENIACRNIDLERDLKELDLIDRFAAERRPILGICRGHQLLNIAFGGDVIQDIDTRERHVQIRDVDQLHETRIVQDSVLARLYGSQAVVCSAHHQAVGRLGEGFSDLQWTDDGVIEAIAHNRLPILGLQWHPERQAFARKRVGAVDGGKIFAYFRRLCIGEIP